MQFERKTGENKRSQMGQTAKKNIKNNFSVFLRIDEWIEPLMGPVKTKGGGNCICNIWSDDDDDYNDDGKKKKRLLLQLECS